MCMFIYFILLFFLLGSGLVPGSDVYWKDETPPVDFRGPVVRDGGWTRLTPSKRLQMRIDKNIREK